jgi:hypothetical protein
VQQAQAQPAPQQGYPAPGAAHAGASATQQTRSSGDSALDKPPKNMLPIYAAAAIAVIVAIVVIAMLAK